MTPSRTSVAVPRPPSAADAGWLQGDLPARPGHPLSRVGRVLLVLFLVVVMALAGLLILAAVTSSTGVLGFLIGTCLALLPLPVVLAVFRWVDRYEPEPRGLLAFAFFWGATVAALVAAVLNTATTMVLAGTGDAPSHMTTTAVFVAPWVEEGAKGAAVLAVFLFRRREFDGIVDGIVIAGLTGVGFAFTENILYFGRAFLAGSSDLGLSGGLFAAGLTFLLRGVLSPFAHPLFTVMTGIGFGVTVRTSNRALRFFAPVIGYLTAVLLHGLWNYSAVGGLSGFLTGYALIMAPAFLLVLLVVIWSRRREGATVAAQLPAYVEAGWLAPEDVAMVASLSRRRQALGWASRTYGDPGAKALRAFQHVATELAFLRDLAERGRAGYDFPQRERSLLIDLARTRAAVATR
ncbi:MAG: protease PrsW [Actinomycetota bacterium]|nr:protease PrsW [Actinomycetota bacterium]